MCLPWWFEQEKDVLFLVLCDLLWYLNDYLDGLNMRRTRSFSCYMITLMIWIWEGCIFLTLCDSLDGIVIPRIIHQSHWCSMGRPFIERRFGVSYGYLVLFTRAIGVVWEDLSSNVVWWKLWIPHLVPQWNWYTVWEEFCRTHEEYLCSCVWWILRIQWYDRCLFPSGCWWNWFPRQKCVVLLVISS